MVEEIFQYEEYIEAEGLLIFLVIEFVGVRSFYWDLEPE